MDFEIFNSSQLMGNLKASGYGDGVIYLTDLYTNKLPQDSRVKGAGTALLYMMACAAEENGCNEIKLAATRSPGEQHPAAYYKRYGFEIDRAIHDECSLEECLKNNRGMPVNMVADSASVMASAKSYLAKEFWEGHGI